MNVNEFQYAADDVSEMMGLLSNKIRLMILCFLNEGEKTVGELAELVGARDTTVSQQLAIMRRVKIVVARREGTTMFYRIIHPDVGKLLGFLYGTFCCVSDTAKDKDYETRTDEQGRGKDHPADAA